MNVEPPPDEDMSPDIGVVTPRKLKRLRQEIARELGISPDDADDWIDEHGEVAAEERIRGDPQLRGYYRTGSGGSA